MSLTLEPFTTWIDRKRREIAAEEPLSIQTNIAALSQRLWKAEQQLEQVARLVDNAGLPPGTDPAYRMGYGDVMADLRRILDGGDV